MDEQSLIRVLPMSPFRHFWEANLGGQISVVWEYIFGGTSLPHVMALRGSASILVRHPLRLVMALAHALLECLPFVRVQDNVQALILPVRHMSASCTSRRGAYLQV